MDDLISEFITETSESMAALDRELGALEKVPGDQAVLGHLARLLHTIKSTSGFLGLPRLESVADAGECCVAALRDGRMDASRNTTRLIFDTLERIHGLIHSLAANGQEGKGDDATLIARLNARVTAPDPVPEVEVTSIPPSPPVLRTPVQAPQKTPRTQPVAEPEDAQNVRVNAAVLETLLQAVSDLVSTRNQLQQIARRRNDPELNAPLQHLSEITTQLQDGVLKTRLLPIGNAWSALPRLVRDVSARLQKKIDLHMVGEATALDRELLEKVKAPLAQIVEYLCTHGLESGIERIASGKPEAGTITVSAERDAGYLILTISDDGHSDGHDSDAPAPELTEARRAIEHAGGMLRMYAAGRDGTACEIKLPLMQAIAPVLLVEAAGQRYALPQVHILELVQIGAHSGYQVEKVGDASLLHLRGELLPLVQLADVLGVTQTATQDGYVAALRVGNGAIGLVFDRVHEAEEIVVKPLSCLLSSLDIYAGTTIIGDGTAVMLLSPAGIARHHAVPNSQRYDSSQLPSLPELEARPTSLLVFRAGEGAPKAVPLDVVARLEMVNAAQITRFGRGYAVPYHGNHLPIATLPEYRIPSSGECDIIICAVEGLQVGLIADSVMDIVAAPMMVKLAAGGSQYLGSAVVMGEPADVVDVGYFIRMLALAGETM